VTRRAAATTMMTVATTSHIRHAAHRSAFVMGVLASGALVVVVLPVARPVHAPESIFLAWRSSRFLRSEVLPLAVEEFDGLIGERLGLHVSPSARHFAGDVPAVLAVRLAVRQSTQAPNDSADRSGRHGRDRSAGRGLVEGAELVGEPRHRAADADAAGTHAPTHMIDGPPDDDVAVHDGAPTADLDETLWIAVVLGEESLFVKTRARAAVVNRLAE